MNTLPLWVRKFAVDFIETGIAAVLAIQFALPSNWDEGLKIGAMLGAALAGALLSAFRRALPDLMAWVNERFGTTPDK